SDVRAEVRGWPPSGSCIYPVRHWDALADGSRRARALSAESDAGEHPFEHGEERLVGVGLAGAGPGEQRGLAGGDDGEPQKILRLDSVAGGGLVVGGGGGSRGA